ncbi:hypothetical protein BAG01nite_24230 [Brevibacillus agri]|uniref:DUF2203 family protein n=1 Tax=Brevibacillus agri TaxID=51101 RepID=A0A3M8B075_9BACL|nr:MULTISPECIES: DUF2203 domain-containing protein [Brevibacillus]ELK42996.1 DivIVA family protein [Brevibacillus agri BAB-2500]EJL44084.1 hypothetical protein PMI08_02204 [Brevibacillus sp. CF112]MBG9564525.1 cell division protein DivIVA [Brevibacillus agri]MBY0053103.1 DUF2203 domain-containing protein [Brevibacillus agri]MCG5253309.1 DUF2203 domain-containing protein [Brevibacillus agri]
MNKKIFTLQEANDLLPYVREELSFLQKSKRSFYEMYQKREQIKKQQPVDEEALFSVECQLEFLELEAKMHVTQLIGKGIQVKDIDIGLFDFPAIIDGEEVLLCWREGEESITHYHGLREGFMGRKPIR